MRPEDVDPMTGMPFGFDQKYFPDGMPPEAFDADANTSANADASTCANTDADSNNDTKC